MKPSGVVTITTDFGLKDHYTGVMKGVILKGNINAKIVDISNQITPFAIDEASYILSSSFKFFPKGSVHLCVVDPGVGSERKAVIVQTDAYFFVGPDNGIFSFLKDEEIINVYEIDVSQLKVANSTFHGRDIFAPVSSALSKGAAPDSLGFIIGKIKRSETFYPTYLKDEIRGRIIHIDSFGNLITNIDSEIFVEKFGAIGFKAVINKKIITSFFNTYDESSSEIFLIAGSSRKIEISVKNGSAQFEASVKTGDPVIIHR